MIFLTVGTQFGFDRLVKAVDEAIRDGQIRNEIFAQIGPGQYKPVFMKYAISLEKKDFDHVLNGSRAMISHAGMGSIICALEHRKPLLVLPRRKRFNEVVNDHQVETAKKFEQMGHVLVAYEIEELSDKCKLLDTFIPKLRIVNSQNVIDRIRLFLSEIK